VAFPAVPYPTRGFGLGYEGLKLGIYDRDVELVRLFGVNKEFI
jgi:hypothetical protein